MTTKNIRNRNTGQLDEIFSMLKIDRSSISKPGDMPGIFGRILAIKEMNYAERRLDITREIMESYLESDPENIEMLLGLAAVYFAQERYLDVEDMLYRVFLYEPGNEEARYLMDTIKEIVQ